MVLLLYGTTLYAIDLSRLTRARALQLLVCAYTYRVQQRACVQHTWTDGQVVGKRKKNNKTRMKIRGHFKKKKKENESYIRVLSVCVWTMQRLVRLGKRQQDDRNELKSGRTWQRSGRQMKGTVMIDVQKRTLPALRYGLSLSTTRGEQQKLSKKLCVYVDMLRYTQAYSIKPSP